MPLPVIDKQVRRSLSAQSVPSPCEAADRGRTWLIQTRRRQTLRMNTDESRSVLSQFVLLKYDEFFVRIKRTVTKDTELAEVSWQARLSHALNCSHKPPAASNHLSGHRRHRNCCGARSFV